MSEFQIHDQTWHEYDGSFSIAVTPKGKLIIGLGEPVAERPVAVGLTQQLAEDLYKHLVGLVGEFVEVDLMSWPNQVTAAGKSFDMFLELGQENVRQYTVIVRGSSYRCPMAPAPIGAKAIVLVIQDDNEIALRARSE